MIEPIKLISWDDFNELTPIHRVIDDLDLVIIKYGDQHSVLYGRCLHRGALLGDGKIEGHNLICGLHGWDFRYDTGISEYNNKEKLYKFKSVLKDGSIWIDRLEIAEYVAIHPQPFDRNSYQGVYADTHPEEMEPFVQQIQQLARDGLSKVGHHGSSAAMGVERSTLPNWDDIQYLPAQLWKKPLNDNHPVNTQVVIGPKAQKPLRLKMPIFVSDMSFGALSREAKIALAKGADWAGTAICSGEGGMLADEQQANSRYLYEYASGAFGFELEKMSRIQAFHFKGGQGAKTGTGGHLPGHKVTKEIAKVRGLTAGQTAISPARFSHLDSPEDFRRFANEIRMVTDGVPIGFKIAASHIEKDIDFAIEAGADYIILDGRGGGTGSAPKILRDHINVPTIPALARARRHLDKMGAKEVSLIITGGLRLPQDFAKALMLGADAVAIANSALQAIGCLGMRACDSDQCPVGIATQKEHLRQRLLIEESAKQLYNFLDASNELIKVVARACGYDHIQSFNATNLSTYHRDLHHLTGINYAGI